MNRVLFVALLASCSFSIAAPARGQERNPPYRLERAIAVEDREARNALLVAKIEKYEGHREGTPHPQTGEILVIMGTPRDSECWTPAQPSGALICERWYQVNRWNGFVNVTFKVEQSALTEVLAVEFGGSY